ncbi:hypothetical protein C362_00620 [Cryptococcus neoformans Bt1]|nr:hypothetical protein C362_00620 [Cryptococcus neoformans var. grubii Bt1]
MVRYRCGQRVQTTGNGEKRKRWPCVIHSHREC